MIKEKIETIKFEDAVSVLQKHLGEDEELYRGYQANIAMAFKDEYHRTGNNLSHAKVHGVANRAAKNFLNMLIKI